MKPIWFDVTFQPIKENVLPISHPKSANSVLFHPSKILKDTTKLFYDSIQYSIL